MNATNVPVARRATEPQIDRVTSISLIVPLYSVELYFPEFLASVENQDVDGIDLECIFVDDGSPMNEAEIAEKWLARTGVAGRVIRKTNGGVSSARNTGIEHATAEWLTFPDPDDLLSPGYFRAIADYLTTREGAKADVVTSKLIFYFEDAGVTRDSHPLTFKFGSRAQNLSLRRMPHVMQLSSATAFVRRSTFNDAGLRFDERLQIAEDAILLARVLAQAEFPLLGVVPDAEYIYRKRAVPGSALDTAGQDPATRLETLELGHLPMLRDLQVTGRLHEWVGHMVLYDLGWLYRQEMSVKPLSAKMTADQRRRFLYLTGEILSLLEHEWIYTSLRPKVSAEVKLLWEQLRYRALGLSHGPVLGDVRVLSLDESRRLLQVSYYCTELPPEETVRVGGMAIVPVASKTRHIDIFDQQVVFERILWVPATSSLRVALDGRLQSIQYSDRRPQFSLLRAEYWKHFGATYRATGTVEPVSRHPYVRRRALRVHKGNPAHGLLLPVEKVRRVAQRQQGKYSGAWLFMDRLDLAGDNAEHLYRHVRKTRPNIRIWFVLERSSPDWERLKRDGFNLVSFRSRLHQVLLIKADNVISSHADIEMTDPIPSRYYFGGRRPWRFSFLQHGILMNDLSRWLNTKKIDTFVTSTKAEYDSLTVDYTPYKVTQREVVLSGLPRHDSLLATSRTHASSASRQRVLLIAPTWRDGLLTPKKAFHPRQPVDGFSNTEYVSQWRKLFQSDSLLALARSNNLKVVFLPHPGMAPYVKYFDVPAGIDVKFYSDGDVQRLFSETDLLVTDYSSLNFEVAYVGAPTIYFQFDRKDVYGGLHTFTPGYFDYEEHGFGPVCDSVDAVVSSAENLLAARAEHGAWPEPYRTRIEETFPFRDGQCSERVIQAILASRPDVAYDSRGASPMTLRRVVRGVARRVRKLRQRAA